MTKHRAGQPLRIRIVAGELRNRRLAVPSGRLVRPTSERAREALFNILGDAVAGAHVLDAFAGSGALGLEAISRGAAWVTFIEEDREALAALRGNVAALGVADRCEVVAGTVDAALRGGLAGAPFSYVLADPPYADDARSRLATRLAVAGILAGGATVVIERDRRSEPAADGTGTLRLVRTARYGDTCLDFYRRVLVVSRNPKDGGGDPAG